jgi:hypothetical protein
MIFGNNSRANVKRLLAIYASVVTRGIYESSVKDKIRSHLNSLQFDANIN